MAAAIPYVIAAASAVSSISSAQQQAAGMRMQAQQAELQGRQNALNYNKQAIAVLDRQNQLASTIRARAAAGGVNPDTGSPLSLQEANALKAGEEFKLAKDNAQMSIYGGLAESQRLSEAADTTSSMGYINAIARAGTSFYAASQAATPKTKMDWYS